MPMALVFWQPRRTFCGVTTSRYGPVVTGGYCLRTPAQGACAYANICEHCPNFRTESTFLPILATQRADAATLAADADARGWGEEAARHRDLVERLDQLMNRADTP